MRCGLADLAKKSSVGVTAARRAMLAPLAHGNRYLPFAEKLNPHDFGAPLAVVGHSNINSECYVLHRDKRVVRLPTFNTSGTGSYTGVTFSPDNTMVVATCQATVMGGGGTFQLRVWDAFSGAVLKDIPTFFAGNTPFSPRFSPDGRFLACCTHSGSPCVAVFDTHNDWAQVVLGGTQYGSNVVVWSPDGSYLITGRPSAPYLASWKVVDGGAWPQEWLGAAPTPSTDVNSFFLEFVKPGRFNNWPELFMGASSSSGYAGISILYPTGLGGVGRLNNFGPYPGFGFTGPTSVSFNHSGEYAVFATTAGDKLYLYRRHPNSPREWFKEPIPQFVLDHFIGGAIRARFAPDRNTIFVLSDGQLWEGRSVSVTAWDMSTWTRLPIPENFMTSSVSSDISVGNSVLR